MELGDHVKREKMDPDESESNWFGYACKSEEILFYYNVKTGERRWATNFSLSEKTILKVRNCDVPSIPKELRSVATQTEDHGCVNQCTSIYVNNEQHIKNRESSSSTNSNSNSNEVIGARVVVVEHSLLNHPAVVDNCDEVSENVETDEPLSTLITGIKRRKEMELVKNQNPRPGSGLNFYNCPFCPRKFKQKSYVEIHIRTHTGEKPFECSYCDKAFTRKTNLIVHLRTHTGERPYLCSHCDKAFSQKNNLNEHLRIHTGEKPHKCLYCEKAFTGKGTLNTHLRIHTGEKPHKCPYCDKAFSWKGDLDRHIGVHTGKKPFGCFYCTKEFTTRTELKMHLRTHTGEKPYKCSYCQKAFINKSNLNVHLRRHTSR